MLAICRSLVGDPEEAQDAAQQTFLSAHKALLSGTRPRDPAAWIATIARNESRARIKQRMTAPLPSSFEDEPEATTGDPAAAAHRNAAVRELQTALEELPDRQREAIMLRELHGLGQQEVASRMNLAVASVESLLWRARKQLEQRAAVVRELGCGALAAPALVRERLGQLLAALKPAQEPAAAAATAASVPLAAKVAAATVATVTVTSIGVAGDRPKQLSEPRATAPPRLMQNEAPAPAPGGTVPADADDARRSGGPTTGDERDGARVDDRSGPSDSSGSGSSSSSGSGSSGTTSTSSGTSGSGSGSSGSSDTPVSDSSGSSGSGSSGSDGSGSTSGSSGSGTSGSTSSGSGSGTSGSSGSGSSGSGSTSGSSGSGTSGSSSGTTSGMDLDSSGSGSSGSGSSSDSSGSGSSGSGSGSGDTSGSSGSDSDSSGSGSSSG